MFKKIAKIDDHATLWRDDRTGIAEVRDGYTGNGHSCHPNISTSGSVKGMKKLGYWGKNDKIARAGGCQFNTSRILVDENSKYDRIAAEQCNCDACIARRGYEARYEG